MTYRNHAEEIDDLRAEIRAEMEDRALQYDRLPRFANLRDPERSGGWMVWALFAVLFWVFVFAAMFAPVIAAEATGRAMGDLTGCLENGGCDDRN